MDEGIIIQVAHNLAAHGKYGLQTAPGVFVSPAAVSTGFPVILPVAASFVFLGENLLAARLVMVLFIFALFTLAYLYMRAYGDRVAVWSVALLATFAPIYGQGKNVLGEVPGLFFLLSFLFCLREIESGHRDKWLFVLCGFAGGITMATKPIFLLLLPALCITAFFFRGSVQFSRSQYLLFSISLIMPVIIWILSHLAGTPIASILAFYGNPSSVDMLSVVPQNLKRFFTELQPSYAALLCVVCFVSIAFRWRTEKKVSAVECFAYIFSFLILLAYIRTMGIYRHFFTAEFILLMYLPYALETIRIPRFHRVIIWIAPFIVVLQIYQTLAHSWLVVNLESKRVAVLSEITKKELTGEPVYLIQVPEVEIFLHHSNYFQTPIWLPRYIWTDDSEIGVAVKKSQSVILHSDFYYDQRLIFNDFTIIKEEAGYTVLRRY